MKSKPSTPPPSSFLAAISHSVVLKSLRRGEKRRRKKERLRRLRRSEESKEEQKVRDGNTAGTDAGVQGNKIEVLREGNEKRKVKVETKGGLYSPRPVPYLMDPG